MTLLPRKPYSKYNPPNEVGKHVQEVYEQIQQVVNGRINYGTPGIPGNIQGVYFKGVTPSTANQPFTITHNLGYIPTGFHVVYKDQYCDLIYGGTAWTTETITLECNQASVNVVLFIF